MTTSDVRRKVLDAFSAKVRRRGIRDVGMNELARDLSMSTKTIYREFANKGDLVKAMLEDWAERFELRMSEAAPATAAEAIEEMAELITYWFGLWDSYPELFWTQLRQDYPDAYVVFQSRMDRDVEAGRRRVEGLVRPDVDRRMSELMLASAVRAARDEAWLREANLTYRDAVHRLVDLWARGTLRRD